MPFTRGGEWSFFIFSVKQEGGLSWEWAGADEKEGKQGTVTSELCCRIGSLILENRNPSIARLQSGLKIETLKEWCLFLNKITCGGVRSGFISLYPLGKLSSWFYPIEEEELRVPTTERHWVWEFTMRHRYPHGQDEREAMPTAFLPSWTNYHRCKSIINQLRAPFIELPSHYINSLSKTYDIFMCFGFRFIPGHSQFWLNEWKLPDSFERLTESFFGSILLQETS